MKRNLLLFAALLVGMSVSAQGWVKPVPAASELKLTEDSANPNVYYLYNKDAGAFFTEGNDWGTRASYGSEGLQVYVTPDVADGWDGKSLFIWDFSIAKNAWKQLFIDNETSAYVDLGSQANYYWEIAASAGGDLTYRIFGGSKNPEYNCTADTYAGCYLGINLDDASTVIYPLLDPDVAEHAAIDWLFVSQEEYDAYLPKIAIYNSAMKLKKAIDEAKGYGLDVAAEENVYNNTDSDKETLDAATDAVVAKINAYKESSASPENPQDVTASFFDAYNFDDQNKGSWKSSTGAQNNQASGTSGKLGNNTNFLENWNGNPFSGKIYYEIENLPNGVYQFGLNVALNGGEGYVYANSSKKYVDSKNFAAEPFKVLAMVDSTKLECGLEIINNSSNWVGVDDAQLMYFGNSLESYQYWIKSVVDSAPDFEADGVFVQKAALEAYKAVLTQAENMTSKEDIIAFIPTFTEALDVMTANYNAYQAYQKTVQEVEQAFNDEDLNGEVADELGDYLIGYEEDILRAGEMSTEEITAEAARVTEMLATARKESIAVGGDATKFLVNPNFTNKLNGWSHDPQYADGAWGGTDANPCVERWNDNFNFYQDATVPNGVYLLKVQAFYRPGDNTETAFQNYQADPTSEEILAYIYANEMEQEVCHIGKHYYAENLEGNCTATTFNGETVYIPNGMNSASTAFANGDYECEVYGVVSDGHLRVGIYSTEGTASGRWTLWDNFRLTYYGKDAEVLNGILTQSIEGAKEMLADEEIFAGKEAKAAFAEAVKAAEDAVASGDGDVMFQAYIDYIAAAKEYDENVAAYVDLSNAFTELLAAAETYQESASDKAVEKAGQLIAEVEEALAEGAYTTAEVMAKIDEIQAAIAGLKTPKGYEDASEDNPVDFSGLIVNGTFDEIGDFHGWEGTAFGAGGTTSTCAEHYSKNYDTYQDIKGLPAGYYVVKVQAFYRRGNSNNEYAIATSEYPDSALNACLYATTFSSYGLAVTDSTTIQPIADGAVETSFGGDTSQFGSDKVVPNTMEAAVNWFNEGMYDKASVVTEVGEGSTLRIGVKKAVTINEDWSIFDNFQLFYLGTQAPVGVESIVAAETVSPVGIFNLAGQRINSLQKGINIVGGKKIFVK